MKNLLLFNLVSTQSRSIKLEFAARVHVFVRRLRKYDDITEI